METNAKGPRESKRPKNRGLGCGANDWCVRVCCGRWCWVVTSKIVGNGERTNEKKKRKTNYGKWQPRIGIYIESNLMTFYFRKRNRVSQFVGVFVKTRCWKFQINVFIGKSYNVLLPYEERCRATRTPFSKSNSV